MTAESLVAMLGIYGGAFAIGAISSIVPIVSIELFVLAVALAHGADGAVLLVVLATAGQVIGKLPIYWSVRGLAMLPGRHRRWIDRARRWSARLGDRPYALVFLSALTGIPPFSLVSTTAGALGLAAWPLCIAMAAGRALRFTVIIVVAA